MFHCALHGHVYFSINPLLRKSISEVYDMIIFTPFTQKTLLKRLSTNHTAMFTGSISRSSVPVIMPQPVT